MARLRRPCPGGVLPARKVRPQFLRANGALVTHKGDDSSLLRATPANEREAQAHAIFPSPLRFANASCARHAPD